MERVTGSKGLVMAAMVSLIIHGGILLTYAFVFKSSGTLTDYEPLKVALIMPSDLEKPVVPLTSSKKEKASFSKEDQRAVWVPADLIKEKTEVTPQAVTPAAKAGGEAAAAPVPQAKDPEVRTVAAAAPKEQNLRHGPETEAPPAVSGVSAYLSSKGASTGRTAGNETISAGAPKVGVSGGETSLSGYAQLTTSMGTALTLAAPRYNENSLPAYPIPARRWGYAGVVLLAVEVLADGRVGRLEMKKTSGYDLLDKSAQETVKGWKFSPGKRMGTPVTMWVEVPVRFELN